MIPAIDAKHDMERIGAIAEDDYMVVGARVRGYGGGSGWSLIMTRFAMADEPDPAKAINESAETLASASRYDSGRDPDALVWTKVKGRALATIFASTDTGLALDGAAYAHAGQPGRPDSDTRSLWVLRDPLFDLHARAREIWSKRPKGVPSVAYGRMPIEDARRLIAGRIARRLPDWQGNCAMTPISISGAGTFKIDPDAGQAIAKSAVAKAIAEHPQCRETATAAAVTGGEAVMLFQRSIRCVDLRAETASLRDAARNGE